MKKIQTVIKMMVPVLREVLQAEVQAVQEVLQAVQAASFYGLHQEITL